MKSLNISRKNNLVQVTITNDLNNRKSILRISEKTAEQRFELIFNKIKTFSKFHSLSLNYNEIDYYDNMVDVYETPYIYFIKGDGKRKPIISYKEHGCIPKDWEECMTLSLDDPKTIKPVEEFLKLFNISLNKKQILDIRKAIKGENIYFLEIN